MKGTTDYSVSLKYLQLTLFFCVRDKWPRAEMDVMSLFGMILAVTGKLWPKLYQIKLREVDGPADGSVENFCPKASFYR